MVYLLPGMGASAQMYTSFPEWSSFKNVSFLDWPTWEGETTIAEMALKLVKLHSINTKDIIAGSSLGGMIALEIAKLVKAEKAILIGSAVKPEEVNKLLLNLSPMINLTPLKLIQLLCGKYNSELIKMFTQTDADFIRCMCLAIKGWHGAEGYDSIKRIHGARDLIIPCPENSNIIAKGGHLIAMTHVKECTTIFKTMIESQIT